MRLKKYTDYALRVMVYVGSTEEGGLSSIKEISNVFNISQNHLSKVVFQLGKLELVDTVRGRGGGIRLSKKPEDINIGYVVRKMEEDFILVDCFDGGSDQCVISPSCKLKHALNDALRAFLGVLDQYTLGDLLSNPNELRALMDMK
ncbi:Rrf2 family transcriptional regulator [Pontibacillus yanchengensis]|uniref:Rrf2 family transcriptional regulator n=2 Tax=Pontibacillus yanchengensis TaxID=462910 RepID=A0ACC7VH10_9BACI|nr:Rrf2 family transcriptional regulator [Pontibacillus yanchengensis]MYL34408.1 Rrf2 family transcriptional regulator [Pontibacillus yanchengensis]MYL54216.1 Rrf2 family transcriptional regulator [Pontibacillus yanchengensis]